MKVFRIPGLTLSCQTKPGRVPEGRGRPRLASNRTGENPSYGMNRGGGGDVGRTRGLFATMLERADTSTREALGLNRSRLRSTRPVSVVNQPMSLFLVVRSEERRVGK